MRKHYLISVVISVAITATIIGIGYLIDRWQGSTPTYMLIGFIVSGPLSVWANYNLIKKKFTNLPETMKGPDQKSKP